MRAGRRSDLRRRGPAPGDDRQLLNAQLRLLEAFLSVTEVAECAQQALQWLAGTQHVCPSLCLLRADGGHTLFTAGWDGVPAAACAFSVDLDDWDNPLVGVVLTHQPRFFPAAHSADERRGRPSTPLGRAAFQAVAIAPDGPSHDALGLLLHAGGPAPSLVVPWLTSVLGRKIQQVLGRGRIAEAQVRAERDRLNLIFESVADPIVVADGSGATSLMNQPAGRLFSATGGSAGVELAVQTNLARLSSFIAAMLVSADRSRAGEVALTDPVSGSPMPVEAVAGKIQSDHGELTGVVTILRDSREATERARLYDQLKESSGELERRIQAATADIVQQNELLRRQAMELEQASMLKSQFLANMSHEFRTPLNAMLGYTSMLLQGVAGPVNGQVQRQLARIESNGRQLLTIINEILDISSIEAGRMPLLISRFTIADLVNEVRAELEPIISRTPLTVSIHLTRGLRRISTDRQKVKQILLNLLSNALKFTHEGTVTIGARARAKDRTVELSVADTGIGIAPADQERIFEDFRQLDNSPTRAYGGPGLGLSICRRLAQMLGGTITVQSQLGAGSRFALMLPI